MATSSAQIHSEFSNPNLQVLLAEDQIRARINELGAQITRDYAGLNPLLIGVLKGACFFLTDLMRAIDIRTGRTLWSDVLPAGGQATPMTYEANGRQFILIMAGGHHFMETPIGDALIAYALPAR